ncbi:reverse transcriptase domain-containing protein [Aeromicrobium sp. 179-A 4D2 NHS]|uniref:reverse transcriptase domain-containing protein n=1 Tax=Aeromicrobium sp. 179-A 4D2 NHS TaxID=3142375 RepID=UPI0039A2EF1F
MEELSALIRGAATEKIRKHERSVKSAQDETKRRSRRTSRSGASLEVSRPRLWEYAPSHDPFRVRARADVIGHAIGTRIKERRYQPFPPAGVQIPKADGSYRSVTAFAIADEVVSKRLYVSLMNKNRARLSARSYAYRKDLGVHDAIAHMQSEWRTEHRVYVAEYDFTDFFGSIDHRHVWRTIEELGLSITRTERKLLGAFMRAPLPTMLPAKMPSDAPRREKGIHQGSTISLLLANIAATPLDRQFERLGVSFARYADDVVVWSRDYESISRAVEELHRFADRSQCSINHGKSEGVRLLTSPASSKAEFRSTHAIEFLSHRLSLRETALADRVVADVKREVDQYIFNHLLREPLRGQQDPRRLRDNLDRDYVALLSQLRRYFYGNLSEGQLRRLLRGPLPPRISLGGLLGRQPLVDDMEQLREIDAWVLSRVWLALRKRAKLLRGLAPSDPMPWGMTQIQLTELMARSRRGDRVDGRVPSLVRMSELMQRAVRAHGTRVAHYAGSLYQWH